jgi:hypothetical protein
MNGAIAELCAKINSTPKIPRTKTIGSIHHRLLL